MRLLVLACILFVANANNAATMMLDTRKMITSATATSHLRRHHHRRQQEEQNSTCVVDESLETAYNTVPEIPPYVGIMFSVEAKTTVDIMTLEVDVRLENAEASGHGLFIEVYVKQGEYALSVNNPDVWTLVASTIPLRAADDRGVVIPSTAFTPFRMTQNERWAFYITMKCPCIDYTAYGLDKTGEVAFQNADLSVAVGEPLDRYKFPDSFDTVLDPKFAGVIHYQKVSSCESMQSFTNVEYHLLFSKQPDINVNSLMEHAMDKYIADSPVLSGYKTDQGLYRYQDAVTEPLEYTGGCPTTWENGCMSTFLRTTFTWVHQDTLSTGQLQYDMYKAYSFLTAAVQEQLSHDVQVAYIGLESMDGSMDVSLSGVPDGATMDEVQAEYLEEKTLELFQDAGLNTIFVYGLDFPATASRRSLRRNLQGATVTHSGSLIGAKYIYVSKEAADSALNNVVATGRDDLKNLLVGGTVLPGPITANGRAAYFENIHDVNGQVVTEATPADGGGEGGGGGGDGDGGSSGPNWGMIGGIIGGVVGVIVLLLAAWIGFAYYRHKQLQAERRKRKEQAAASDTTDESGASPKQQNGSTGRPVSRPQPIKRRSQTFEDVAFDVNSLFSWEKPAPVAPPKTMRRSNSWGEVDSCYFTSARINPNEIDKPMPTQLARNTPAETTPKRSTSSDGTRKPATSLLAMAQAVEKNRSTQSERPRSRSPARDRAAGAQSERPRPRSPGAAAAAATQSERPRSRSPVSAAPTTQSERPRSPKPDVSPVPAPNRRAPGRAHSSTPNAPSRQAPGRAQSSAPGGAPPARKQPHKAQSYDAAAVDANRDGTRSRSVSPVPGRSQQAPANERARSRSPGAAPPQPRQRSRSPGATLPPSQPPQQRQPVSRSADNFDLSRSPPGRSTSSASGAPRQQQHYKSAEGIDVSRSPAGRQQRRVPGRAKSFDPNSHPHQATRSPGAPGTRRPQQNRMGGIPEAPPLANGGQQQQRGGRLPNSHGQRPASMDQIPASRGGGPPPPRNGNRQPRPGGRRPPPQNQQRPNYSLPAGPGMANLNNQRGAPPPQQRQPQAPPQRQRVRALDDAYLPRRPSLIIPPKALDDLYVPSTRNLMGGSKDY